MWIIFLLTSIFFAVKWIAVSIVAKALLLYLHDRGLEPLREDICKYSKEIIAVTLRHRGQNGQSGRR